MKRQPSMRQEPIQQQPLQQQPLRQQPLRQEPLQQQSLRQEPIFRHIYDTSKKRNIKISFVVFFIIFILFTCINSSNSVYDKDKPSTILNIVFYSIISLLLIINSVMIVL